MAFTKKTLYTIKALVFLEQKGTLANVTEIVKATEIPKKFLEAIMLDLKKNGFVDSFNGRKGGYVLLKSLSEISLNNILNFTECQNSKPMICDSVCNCLDKVQCTLNKIDVSLFENYQIKIESIKMADFI